MNPRTFFGLCLLLLLNACQIGALGKQQTIHYYVLDATANHSIELQHAQLPIDIRHLSLPTYLERPQLMTRNQQYQMRLAENHQWAGNLRKNIRRTLMQNLSIYTASKHINLHPTNRHALKLDLAILNYEYQSHGHVLLQVQWMLSNATQTQQQISRYTSRPVKAHDYRAISAAMSLLLSQLSHDIVLQADTMQP